MHEHVRLRLAVFDALVAAIREADRAYGHLQSLLATMAGQPGSSSVAEAIKHLTSTRRAVTEALCAVEGVAYPGAEPAPFNLLGSEEPIRLLLDGETQD